MMFSTKDQQIIDGTKIMPNKNSKKNGKKITKGIWINLSTKNYRKLKTNDIDNVFRFKIV